MTIRRSVRELSGLALFLICAGSASGTKPCPPSPCLLPNGALDRAACRDLASWVAIGTIKNVVHHEAGPPLLKDFAEFTFKVERWEKGSGPKDREIRFRVGWCQNSQVLPRDTSGSFRFFGLALPKDSSSSAEYLQFERLEGKGGGSEKKS